LASSERESKQPGKSRSTLTADECLNVISHPPSATMTCEQSESTISPPLTSSQVDFLARISATQENERESTESTADSGVSTSESLANYDRDSSLSKTSQHCSQAENGEKSQLINAYAAGLIDGEGCITIAHRKMKSFSARIDVGMSAKGMPCLEKLKVYFGGHIRRTREKSEQWEEAFAWALFGKAATPFLEAILPHLELKKPQAMYAISLQKMIAALPQARQGAAAWTQEAVEEATTIRALVQELNQKGPIEQKMDGWFARLVGGKWITPQRDLFSSLQWDEFSETWPRSGMTRNGIAYPRRPLVPRISGTGFGYLPTPDASLGAFETTGKMDVTSCYRKEAEFGLRPSGAKIGSSLRWCPELINEKLRTGGELNPEWLEVLQGFPVTWTALKDSATPSSRKSQSGLESE